MLILAVDTAADIGSVALTDGDRILELTRLQAGSGFGQTLFGDLEALLTRHGIRIADIELYAASSGPGSFTGVRVGLAAIKGLAEVAGKPAVGVSSLAALAEFGHSDLRAPVIDARRGEVFAAVFDSDGREVLPATVSPLPAFREIVGDRPVEWITVGFEIGLPATTVAPELAGMIARIAFRRFSAGELCDPASMEANYVRRSDAEILWKAY